jgi:hypothetical protein
VLVVSPDLQLADQSRLRDAERHGLDNRRPRTTIQITGGGWDPGRPNNNACLISHGIPHEGWGINS